MDTPDVYPDVLGDAFSYSSQRLAQLGSLIIAGATAQARRQAQKDAAQADRSQRELQALHDQERAGRQQARAGWAPAHDSKWLAQADLLQTARTWSAATAYADADPAAASAVRKCEERLHVLHPYAMAWYDRLRGDGAGAFDAMRQAVPLFARAPHARPGDPAAERRSLAAPAGLDAPARDGGAYDGALRQAGPGSELDRQVEQRGYQIVRQLQARALAERGYALSPDELATTLGATTTLPSDVIARLAHADGEDHVAATAERPRADDLDSAFPGPSLPDGLVRSEHDAAAGKDQLMAETASARATGDRTAAQLAAQSFPCTATDAVIAAATAGTQTGRSTTRTVMTPTARRHDRPG